jgi:hypothetical protein
MPPADFTTSADDPVASDARAALDPGRSRWPFRRLALGFSPTPHSGLMLLLVGAALGPAGLRVLTGSMLSTLEPPVSVALVALGVLVGLDLVARPPGEGRLLAVASLDAAITILIVAAGMALMYAWSPGGGASWVLPLMLGICAAPSSSPVDESDDRGRQLAARIADLDDVLPIALSALIMILWTGGGAPASRAALLVQAGLLAGVMAVAVRVLISQTSSESEQRVFTIGGLLLLGGTAAYLSLSAPLIGLISGVLWSAGGGAAHDRIARDVRYLQHPLTVLLLVVAGAHMTVSADVLILVTAYIMLRMAGKVAGGWAVSRAARAVPHDEGLFFSAPGMVGVAIALDALYSHGDAAAPFFTIVIAGSLGAEVLGLLLEPRRERTP